MVQIHKCATIVPASLQRTGVERAERDVGVEEGGAVRPFRLGGRATVRCTGAATATPTTNRGEARGRLSIGLSGFGFWAMVTIREYPAPAHVYNVGALHSAAPATAACAVANPTGSVGPMTTSPGGRGALFTEQKCRMPYLYRGPAAGAPAAGTRQFAGDDAGVPGRSACD